MSSQSGALSKGVLALEFFKNCIAGVSVEVRGPIFIAKIDVEYREW